MYLKEMGLMQLASEIDYFAKDTAKYVQLYTNDDLSPAPVSGYNKANAGFVFFEELKPLRYTLAGFAATAWALIACTQELYSRRNTLPLEWQKDWPRSQYGNTVARFEDALLRLQDVAVTIEAGSTLEDVLHELVGQPGLAAHNVLQAIYSPHEHAYWIGMHHMLQGTAPVDELEVPGLD